MYIHRNWNSMQASARHYLNDIDLLWFSLTCLHQFSTIFWKWCRYELYVSPRVLLHQGCESKQQLVPVNYPCMLTTASSFSSPGQTTLPASTDDSDHTVGLWHPAHTGLAQVLLKEGDPMLQWLNIYLLPRSAPPTPLSISIKNLWTDSSLARCSLCIFLPQRPVCSPHSLTHSFTQSLQPCVGCLVDISAIYLIYMC